MKRSKDTMKFITEILEIIIIVFALSWFLKTYVIDFAAVNSDGMLPALGKNNHVLVIKLFKSKTTLERGDIVVFTDTADNQVTKRLIGFPGETIEVRNGLVYVNGKPVYEPYAHTPINYDLGPLIMKKNQTLVLNDYRSNLTDSKELGTVPFEKILGRAVFCYWPVTKIQLL